MGELLIANNLVKRFRTSGGFFRTSTTDILKQVSLNIGHGETVGLVGESGSGKTTLARCITGMLTPEEGDVQFDGIDIHALNRQQKKHCRQAMAMVYQNPYLSLNPHFTLYELIAEPLEAAGNMRERDRQERVANLMAQVGLADIPLTQRVTTLSGGQAQRIAIARALALKPKLIVLDEPTSALDVSVQAQILNLLVALKESQNLSYLLITHNLDVVRYICDRVIVMSEGVIVEQGETENVMTDPQHAYTQLLIQSTPQLPTPRPPTKDTDTASPG